MFDRFVHGFVCIPSTPFLNPTTARTRIVRGSDYSPASALFSRVRKTMTGNNPKLDLLKVDAHKKMVRFCQNSLKVLSGNKILTSIKSHNSVKSLQKK